MSNKLKTGLALFAIIITGTFLTYCSADSELKSEDVVLPDEITVQESYVSEFTDKYKSFVSSLPDKKVLENFIQSKEGELAALREQAECNCGIGMASCSASSWFSECCICWNPTTHTGACGVYWGVASCKNELIVPPVEGRASAEGNLIKFYPARFNDMLTLLERNGANTVAIKAALLTLVSQAE